MNPPVFWARNGVWPRVLSPIAALVAAVTARRLRRPGWRAPVPVICCGNAGAGGAGKTTLVLDLAARLLARGVAVHCLTRGYGGSSRGPLRVDPAQHSAAVTGDEPLLLAALAPCWVGADRAATARLAVAAGAEALLMDDGLQNPGLVQDAGLLVIDGTVGFGNGRVIPAGPLREPVAAAAARCRAAVLIGPDRAGAAAALPPGFPVLRAHLVPDASFAGRRVVAFAGIARPGKFYESLRAAGAEVVGTCDFADHHPFGADEITALRRRAHGLGAELVTTAKDLVRLPPDRREGISTAGVSLRWEDGAALDRFLDEWSRPGPTKSRAANPQ